MTNPADPAVHRQAETRLIEHIQALLDNPKLRIDTTIGTRQVAALRKRVARADAADETRRHLAEARQADPDLLPRLPRGEALEVSFHRTKWGLLSSLAARLRVICRSPIKSLVNGEPARPMTAAEVNRVLEQFKTDDRAPTTVVILSTSGFSIDAHDMAQRMATRTLVLVEPNRAGGFSVWGPTETKALNDLLDPETEDEKRARIRAAVTAREDELATDGVSADRIADQTLLPLSMVEEELRGIAKADKSLRAQRLDGRIVLHRAEATPAGSSGGVMPLVERIRAAFSPRSSDEKRLALFADRRDAMAEQRDSLAEQIQLLEKKDAYLCQQFKEAGSEPAKRRLAAQLVQFRRELDRKQQMLNVTRRHLAEIETIVRAIEGKGKLPPVEDIATAAAKAEEELTKLAAAEEKMESVAAAIGGTLSAEEQAVYDHLNQSAG